MWFQFFTLKYTKRLLQSTNGLIVNFREDKTRIVKLKLFQR